MQSKLHDAVLSLLLERVKTVPLKHIAKDAHVDYDFMKRLVGARNKEHSAERLETLYKYLTGRELQL